MRIGRDYEGESQKSDKGNREKEGKREGEKEKMVEMKSIR